MVKSLGMAVGFWFVNKKLWCDVDDKPDCSHIHYVLMLPEIVKLKDKIDQI